MCKLYLEGTRAIVDLSKCPYEFASPEFIAIHLRDLESTYQPIKTIRYEEEIVVELDEKKTAILMQYAMFLRQIESLILRKDVYGMPQDPMYNNRRDLFRKFLDYAFMNPLLADQFLSEYKEEEPRRSIFYKGYTNFFAWIRGILKKLRQTAFYKLVKQSGGTRQAFLKLVELKSLYFIDSIVLEIPSNAKPVDDPDAHYTLPYGIKVDLYRIPGNNNLLYVLSNPIIDNLPADLKKMLKNYIQSQFKESIVAEHYDILVDQKTDEYKTYFITNAIMNNIKITPEQAYMMGREAASWVYGLGAYIENIALDKENVTDIYIDAENSPIYLEHRKFGVCHTLYRYNRDLLERAFRNIVLSSGGEVKFDANSPIVDVVVKRLDMRCHLQRPPATFEELQGALRIMREEPFTYPQYFLYRSMSPFFAGYDDVMVSLGTSEAVLGLKGVGKTAFTAAKITSIGTRRRIIPIQDIEEIPVRAFRKRGFHIGAARVTSGGEQLQTSKQIKTLDLVAMANALLRMGDAAIIINEVRSKSAIQGIINLLNTQPGVFLLYNLHAESLQEVADRLELVFGIPSASMYSTDRYTFLTKHRYGRKGRYYRMLKGEYESDIKNRKFVQIFDFDPGENIDEAKWKTLFLKNPEADQLDFSKVDLKKLEDNLDIDFVPPALKRRCEDNMVSPEQFILQSFFKGKMYYEIYKASKITDDPVLINLDFVLKANTAANQLIVSMEDEHGDVPFADAWEKWVPMFKDLVKTDKLERKNLTKK